MDYLSINSSCVLKTTYLLASYLICALYRGHVDKVLQDGSVGRYPNARPNENRYVICVPVLLSGAVWTIEVQLKKAEPSLGIEDCTIL